MRLCPKNAPKMLKIRKNAPSFFKNAKFLQFSEKAPKIATVLWQWLGPAGYTSSDIVPRSCARGRVFQKIFQKKYKKYAPARVRVSKKILKKRGRVLFIFFSKIFLERRVTNARTRMRAYDRIPRADARVRPRYDVVPPSALVYPANVSKSGCLHLVASLESVAL